MFASWVVFPLVLAAIALGCGLLVKRASGARIPGALLPATGIALVIVVAELLTLDDATAVAATPVAVVLALLGFALSFPLQWRRIAPWAVAAAVAAFAIYAAPIVLSGHSTFAGYVKLDDTAGWMALTDRVLDHGRSLAGLQPSSYRSLLWFYLNGGYPIGVFLPLGIGRALVGQDVAWVFQPYLAFLAALVGLGAWSVAEPAVRSPRLRALAAVLGASSTLLYGYFLWGGVKEVASAALIVTLAGLAAASIRDWATPRPLIPLALVSAALVGVVGGGAALWLAPILLVVAVATWLLAGPRRTLRRAGVAAVGLAVFVLAPGGRLPYSAAGLTGTGNVDLFHPLSGFQLFGVWPSGDFRLNPSDPVATYVLIAIAGIAAAVGVVLAVRARSWALLIYVGGALVSGLAIFALGSPWIGAKALASASPAIPLLAAVGGSVLFALRRRVAGAILIAALVAGIVWSDGLAYQGANLAPAGQLAELQTIGQRIDGEGPTLVNEYEPYAFAHFLRDATPDGATDPGRDRERASFRVAVGALVDTDRLPLDGLLAYRTLVLRRSPVLSRPPSPYRLTYRGAYYEVWQRPARPGRGVVEHMPLGGDENPAGVPFCTTVHSLAQEAGPGGRLAAVRRGPVAVVPTTRISYPASWTNPLGRSLPPIPVTSGTMTARVRVPRRGTYDVWLGGSIRPKADLFIDGREIGSVRHELEQTGSFTELGTASLAPGRHTIAIRFHGSDLHPGSEPVELPSDLSAQASGPSVSLVRPYALGPLALSDQDPATSKISYFSPHQASRLCGRPWDWIEALPRSR